MKNLELLQRCFCNFESSFCSTEVCWNTNVSLIHSSTHFKLSHPSEKEWDTGLSSCSNWSSLFNKPCAWAKRPFHPAVALNHLSSARWNHFAFGYKTFVLYNRPFCDHDIEVRGQKFCFWLRSRVAAFINTIMEQDQDQVTTCSAAYLEKQKRR